MPSPLTPKRTLNRRDSKGTPTKPKPVDLGKPLGPYDTNLVRDRVRQWQSQGGGVVTASDICVEEEEDDVVCKSKVSRENPKDDVVDTEGRTPKTPRNRSSRRKSRIEEEERDRNRSGSAPKKRVVSDKHWRKQRSPPRTTDSPKAYKESTPTKVFPEDGIRVRAIPDEEQRKSSSYGKDTTAAKRPSVGNDDGIRVYATPPGSRRQSEHIQVLREEESGSRSEDSDAGKPSSRTTPSPPRKHALSRRQKDTSPEKTPKLSPSATRDPPKKRRSSQRREGTPERSPQSNQETPFERGASTKSSKLKILSHVIDESKKLLTRPEIIPIAVPRIPTVEAWLSETPDPFIDGDDPPVEIPPPLNTASRRRREAELIIPEDPNKIWETLEEKPRVRDGATGSKRRRRVPSSTLYEDNPFPEDMQSASTPGASSYGSISAAKLVDLVHVQVAPEPSPPTLERRGANRDAFKRPRERRKSSPLKESPTRKDDNSVVSAAQSTSSVEPVNSRAPLRPPGLNIRRQFPSTGLHRLSTIASVETFSSRVQEQRPPSPSDLLKATQQSDLPDEEDTRSEARDHFDSNGLKRRASKSRVTKHADLISVLSLPRAGSRSIQSARSIRTNRSRLATATIQDLMSELANDESKYIRELLTLVDGVIPVLLTCVLSKSDSSIAAGLFSPLGSAKKDPQFTRPIVDMGIALEMLKTLHKRIPQSDSDALLSWARGAQKVYSEYLKAWRMGFQDVVVNLAPASDDATRPAKSPSAENDGLEEGLPRNKDGDVVNANGERVDVAFLLKRPLVRLKYLAKTLKGINFIKPSVEAENLATKYQDLVIAARHRSNEERARLEDEAAANIDPTRARDPRTLGPLAEVSIDGTRRVRARDYFNLDLKHSSGQRIDCRVEFLLRDDPPDQGASGDVLICEVDGTGRWLLLPPIQSGRISARNGDMEGEIVVMIRGLQTSGQEWHELLSLRTDDEQTGFEWVQMLGLNPIPPKIVRSQSFINKQDRMKVLPAPPVSELTVPIIPTTPTKSRTPSPGEIEIPIGERAGETSKTWTESLSKPALPTMPAATPSRERNRLQKILRDSPFITSRRPTSNSPSMPTDLQSQRSDSPTILPDSPYSPRNLNEALSMAGSSSAPGLRRAKAKRRSRHADETSTSPLSTPLGEDENLHKPYVETTTFPEVQPDSLVKPRSLLPEAIEICHDSSHKRSPGKAKGQTRPRYHRSMSSVPSLELPVIPKIRKDSPPPTPTFEPEEEPDWPTPGAEDAYPPSTPSKLTKKRQGGSPVKTEVPPSPPAHRSPSPVQIKGSRTPDLSSASAHKARRRSSSPLKHEYEPSTASESSSDSDASTVARNEAASISDSSEDEELEDGDVPTPLLPLGVLQRISKASPQESLSSSANDTLSPSQSASQAPYKSVPSQPSKASKTIASIFSWSDKGCWQSLHAEECSIVITPGLIEAFEMSAAHSEDSPSPPPPEPDDDSELSSSQVEEPKVDKPLIGLELTPLVPIRRGTALDISIRSPPTSNSKITSGNNIMFRSRNPEECEALYALINYSRINNPTYIALQNARVTSSFGPTFDRSNSVRPRSSSWFGFGHGGRSSYRASSAPTPSIAPSESSIGSMSSAFSALKRFGKGGSMFNIARSTITSRTGSRANSVYTSSDNSSGSGASSPLPPGLTPPIPMNANEESKSSPLGLSNAKIRLYIRETASKWRDLGSARLTIMRPTNSSHPLLTPASAQRNAQSQDEKRILVRGKAADTLLLDVTLGESCFERVARTGIAVSVWEAFEGGMVQKEGGVVGGSLKVYMIQHGRLWVWDKLLEHWSLEVEVMAAGDILIRYILDRRGGKRSSDNRLV
ncbi:MAG: hypothetical protein Q9187_004147 [Circinaria calcarea]